MSRWLTEFLSRVQSVRTAQQVGLANTERRDFDYQSLQWTVRNPKYRAKPKEQSVAAGWARAEDSPLKLVLEAETYNVLSAGNMRNLRHLISRFPVNAVLIDADAKPEQYECKTVAEEVKQSRPDVPIIMLSTRDWLTANDCGSADFRIAKGTSPVEIIRAIEKIMGDRQPEVRVSTGTKPNRLADT